ncbi:unannotated protein [freshwater metagenome]|uniref:Unannotated protein n=1 Tax=freshwater metagenome TaxID=449393 RepID=A0A6J6ZVV7_9ZZZZ
MPSASRRSAFCHPSITSIASSAGADSNQRRSRSSSAICSSTSVYFAVTRGKRSTLACGYAVPWTSSNGSIRKSPAINVTVRSPGMLRPDSKFDTATREIPKRSASSCWVNPRPILSIAMRKPSAATSAAWGRGLILGGSSGVGNCIELACRKKRHLALYRLAICQLS